MARLPRLNLPGVPQHVIQRGNNRQVCFTSDDDCAAYMGWLREAAEKHDVAIHAFVLMTNHVHLLMTPETSSGVSQVMQTLGRQYVRYFNYRYKRSGTLWEGRYKSCLVSSDDYLLDCYRYIELNPVVADMVERPEHYKWSSYRSNAEGLSSSIITPHALYTGLGETSKLRQEAYRTLFAAHLDPQRVEAISKSVNTGLVLGNDRFKAEVANLLGRRVTPLKVGRPLGAKKANTDIPPN